MRHAFLRGLSQKSVASYLKKHNTTTVTSLFFYEISANFNALVPLFLQLLYSSLAIFHWKSSTDAMTSLSLKNCATTFFQQWEQIQEVRGCWGWGNEWFVATFSRSRHHNTTGVGNRPGHGALSYSGWTSRCSFLRRLLFSASRTLNQDIIYINKYVNVWSFKLWQ